MSKTRNWKRIQEVQEAEEAKLNKIRELRKDEPARTGNRIGLAISGGGIRTATLNLGILEVLRENEILKSVDYLSTVSGGGFVGAWLVASTHRVSNWLNPPPAYPLPDPWEKSIDYLRRYASYLSPRLGLLSADTWTMAMIWLRNTLLIQITIAFLLAFLLLLPRVAASALQGWSDLSPWRLTALVVLFVYANAMIMLNIKNMHSGGQKKYASQGRVQLLIVLPMFAFALLAGSELWGTIISKTKPEIVNGALNTFKYSQLWQWTYSQNDYWITTTVGSAVILCLFGFCSLEKKNFSGAVYAVLSAIVSTVVLYSLIVVLLFLFQSWLPSGSNDPTSGYWYSSLTGGIAVVYALSLSIVLQIGMLGSSMPDERREWWSRLGAWFFIYGSVWFLLSVVSVLGPYILSWVLVHGQTLVASVGFGWIATTVAAIFSSKSGGTSGPRGKEQSPILEYVTAVGPYIFIAGLFIQIATGVHWAMIQASTWQTDSLNSWPGAPLLLNYWSQVKHLSPGANLAALGISLAGLLLFSWRVDINEFSLNMFYHNRLVRCYLGASNASRKPHPFTGFDEKDDVELVKIAGNADYAGPIHIVNTTLNLSQSSDLEGGIQSRQSAPFFFTPYHLGSDREAVQFRDLEHYLKPGVTLGTAITISGAAASPNQGYHTSPVAAFLMTLFNVRLGWWMPNPLRMKNAAAVEPGLNFSIGYLMMELFGMAGEDSRLVNLSDGGHLENLGIYELVRRKCSLIIAGDGEQDIDMHFGSLGNVIRMCKVDHHAEIEIDISGIHKNEETGLSGAHCAVGKIMYADGSHGTLIYLKSSLTGDEPTDIEQYKSDHPDFPHETTADQFFNEAQFESYRKLGRHIATKAFEEAFDTLGKSPDLSIELPVLMTQIWHPRSSATAGDFTKHSQTLSKIWKELRDNTELAFLDRQTYPEWETANPGEAFPDQTPWIPSDEQQFRKAFYVCNQMIQLMENVYHDLNLENERVHPDNSGWMNFFHHWSSSGMFRVTWAISGCTYGSGFQRFCLHHLGLKGGFKKEVVTIRANSDQLNPVEEQILKTLDPTQSGELKILRIVVSDRLDPLQSISLHAGFALIKGENLRYMRIQDHLRQTGLGTYLLKHCGARGLELPSESPDAMDWEQKRFRNWANRRGVV